MGKKSRQKAMKADKPRDIKNITLADQLAVTTQLHPLVLMTMGSIHSINSFMASFMNSNPPPEVQKNVCTFLGTTFGGFAMDWLNAGKNVDGGTEAPQEEVTPQIVSPDGSPLGGGN